MIPAIDVLHGDVDPAMFAGKIVLVGVTEPTLGDQHLVPTDRAGNTSGVIVLANAANTIMSSGYLYPADRLSESVLVALVALGGGVLVAFSVLAAPALLRCGRLAESEAQRIAPIVDELAGLGVFEGVNRAAIEAIAAAAVVQPVSAGDVVITEGAVPDDLYVIRAGTFSATTAARGTLRLMTVGDWFGEIGLIERRPRTASVVAQSPGELWRIPGVVFLQAVEAMSAIPDPLRRGVAARLRLSALLADGAAP